MSLEEWWEMVDRKGVGHNSDRPLRVVLGCFVNIASDNAVLDNLARIVAVCEAQVGNGWQADPDIYEGGYADVTLLVAALGMPSDRWVELARVASWWLRDLTEADR